MNSWLGFKAQAKGAEPGVGLLPEPRARLPIAAAQQRAPICHGHLKDGDPAAQRESSRARGRRTHTKSVRACREAPPLLPMPPSWWLCRHGLDATLNDSAIRLDNGLAERTF